MKIKVQLTHEDFKEMLELYGKQKLGCQHLVLDEDSYIPAFWGSFQFEVKSAESEAMAP